VNATSVVRPFRVVFGHFLILTFSSKTIYFVLRPGFPRSPFVYPGFPLFPTRTATRTMPHDGVFPSKPLLQLGEWSPPVPNLLGRFFPRRSGRAYRCLFRHHETGLPYSRRPSPRNSLLIPKPAASGFFFVNPGSAPNEVELPPAPFTRHLFHSPGL